jgi:hypothetical protein
MTRRTRIRRVWAGGRYVDITRAGGWRAGIYVSPGFTKEELLARWYAPPEVKAKRHEEHQRMLRERELQRRRSVVDREQLEHLLRNISPGSAPT